MEIPTVLALRKAILGRPGGKSLGVLDPHRGRLQGHRRCLGPERFRFSFNLLPRDNDRHANFNGSWQIVTRHTANVISQGTRLLSVAHEPQPTAIALSTYRTRRLKVECVLYTSYSQ
jgi:hypothetical protein